MCFFFFKRPIIINANKGINVKVILPLQPFLFSFVFSSFDEVFVLLISTSLEEGVTLGVLDGSALNSLEGSTDGSTLGLSIGGFSFVL